MVQMFFKQVGKRWNWSVSILGSHLGFGAHRISFGIIESREDTPFLCQLIEWIQRGKSEILLKMLDGKLWFAPSGVVERDRGWKDGSVEVGLVLGERKCWEEEEIGGGDDEFP